MADPKNAPSEAAKKAQADYNRLRLATCVEETVLGRVPDQAEGPPTEAHFANPQTSVFANIPEMSNASHISSVQVGVVGETSTVSVLDSVTPDGRLERDFSPALRDPDIRDSRSASADKGKAIEVMRKVEACMNVSAKPKVSTKPTAPTPKQ